MRVADDKMRQYLKKVTADLLATKEKLRRGEERADDPVVVVGTGCRFPGGVRSAQDLWDLVDAGRDAIGEFPGDRHWDVEALYDPDPQAGQEGRSYVREGGFIDAGAFDAGFFGISPREALVMDPQQRVLLEVVWETLESAGIDPETLRDSDTGVFCGVTGHDYDTLWKASPYSPHGIIGNIASVVSGRVSYFFDFTGPSVTVDTACSSSLVAIHQAALALRVRECSLAVAAGVTILSTSRSFVEFCGQGVISRTARCRSFAAGADGTIWAEGAGVVLLERLSDARRNGHRVLATLRGSAVNQDGRSNGLSAPNGEAQRRVIGAALANAGLSPRDVDAVEAHGTGTALGDPIEGEALVATYGCGRAPQRPLRLGSVKSNIGHSQAAAGVAGVLKMIMAMRHRRLPRTLHVDEPTAKVDWRGAVALLTEPVEWERGHGPRRAAVSSFGISGTNAHLILEEAPEDEDEHEVEATATGTLPVLAWPVSAKTERALPAQAAGLLDVAGRTGPADLGFSLATTRSAFRHRAVLLGRDRDSLLNGLHGLAGGEPGPEVVTGVATTGRVGMLFTGQGSQRPGMALALAKENPVFDEICAELDKHLETPLREILAAPDGGLLDRTDHAQAALFAVEVALFRIYESWGLRPRVLLGHSIGEIAAAHVAGVWSLADACRLVAARGQLMAALPEGGAMLSIRAPEHDVLPSLEGRGDRVAIAAVNAADAVVVSGELAEIERLESLWASEGRRTRRLRVSHAFHSPLMEPMLAEFEAVVAGLTAHEPRIPIVSNVTGRLATAGQLTSPAYWAQQIRRTVRFHDGLGAVLAKGVDILLELGPDAVLSPLVEQAVAVPTLRKDHDDDESVLRALATVWAHGAAVDWRAVFAPAAPRAVALPTYPFQHEHYWLSAPAGAADVAAAGLGRSTHPFLGAVVDLADGDGRVLTGRLSLAEHPWLAGHRVHDTLILPATAFVEMALHAGELTGCEVLRELTLQAPLLPPEDGGVRIQIQVGAPDDTGTRTVRVFSRPDDDGPWQQHAAGLLAPGGSPGEPALTSWPPPGLVPTIGGGIYERPDLAGGWDYTGAFRGMGRVWLRELPGGGTEVYGEVALPAEHEREAGHYRIHPALLDAALQTVGLGPYLRPVDTGTGVMPFTWSGFTLHRPGPAKLRVRVRGTDGQVKLTLADDVGLPVATVENLVWRPIPARLSAPSGRRGDRALLGLDWVEATGSVDAQAEVYRVVAEEGDDVPALVRATVERVTGDLAGWLADARHAGTRLAVLTRGAVAAGPGETAGLIAAPALGLARAAQAENPGRIVLVDVDEHTPEDTAVALALTTGAPQVAVRDGRALVPVLRPADADGLLNVPEEPAWRLAASGAGTLDDLALVPFPEALEPLGDRDVRVEVRAAGVNFRDVLITLGMYPGSAIPGAEAAGVVREVGPEVTRVRPGDRVTGVFGGAFGAVAVTDERLVAPIPPGWSFEDAAAVPIAWLTAYHGLADLARLRVGETVLVHSGAGGVGIAAIQLARHLGAEVFATASTGKWAVLRDLGLDDDHLASSRTTDFEQRFRAITRGRGLDVVLNSLTGEFLDASLRLLAPGGRFVEIGKADPRDPAELAGRGIAYQAFDLVESAGPDRIAGMSAELFALFERGVLRLPPRRDWDIRRAPEALRFVSQARHVGKVVLTVPRTARPEDTVLITGASGRLGRDLARHLARGGARRLLLFSRRGSDAPGTDALVAELTAAGTTVSVVAGDVGSREDVRRVLDSVVPEHPLGAVVHAAGVLADGVLGSITGEQLERVLRPKVDGAWHLHELTRDAPPAEFVCFSSAAGVLGAAGQGAYAAANSFLDALMTERRAAGLPATSLAWGPWAPDGDDSSGAGMAGGLDTADWARLGRGGMLGLTTEQGLDLWDAARASDRVMLAPMRLDLTTIAGLDEHDVPAMLRELAGRSGRRRAVRPRSASAASPEALGALAPARRRGRLRELVRIHVAAVLGYASADEVAVELPFHDLGFDSLTSVELRNRIGGATGLQLPATLAFDQPTPLALIEHLDAELTRTAAAPAEPTPAPSVLDGLAALEAGAAGLDDESRGEVRTRLRALLDVLTPGDDAGDDRAALRSATTVEELFDFVDREFG
ncbi:SDR family NAD(P)-dependent oxidoreductase [Micromonospora sp. NBC_01412]|uniref:SDR family NAD(P)-dependent oxidoreductase n=1 Tax=Micromonospora sp. NBC_01412 TaxID=2903590 RepID=UPI0032446025